MYVIEFFKRMFRKANIPIIVYLVLNVFIIGTAIACLFQEYIDILLAYPIGIGIYFVSVAFALSPVGEWILRLQTGCKKIKRQEQLEYLMPLFEEVYAKAKRKDPTIPDGIQLYINDDEEENAFATGRKTICITKGMLNLPPEQIKATLGHEFGHIAHKDTDLILVVAVGNMIVNGMIVGIRLMVELIHLMFACISIFGGREGVFASIGASIYRFCMLLFISGLTWLWTKIGVLLVMKSSRDKEYEADKFSYELGYGNELCMVLDTICGTSNSKGLFANLASSHPNRDERIGRLQQLGASYRVAYGNN